MSSSGSFSFNSVRAHRSAAGGVTFAQSDTSYNSMPRTAMATGNVDFLLPSTEIAKSLLRLVACDAISAATLSEAR
jgi:two-component system CheB/CheR fusion protein